MSKVYSSKNQLQQIANILTGYLRVPFARNNVPGELVENVIGFVRNGDVLNTYDFVDVINTHEKVGWQVKSTKALTPVTWKRAKIPNSNELIKESERTKEGTQRLGNAIIRFCNENIKRSMEKHSLEEIGFSRLIVHASGKLTYFEKLLCSLEQPEVFYEDDFSWEWPSPKETVIKEQLPALHGWHTPTQKKWFAWHGRGENQLHFSGEKYWWPTTGANKIEFNFPETRLSQEEFMKILSDISSSVKKTLP